MDDLAVPVETERSEIVELGLFGTGTYPIEILDAHQESAVRGSGEQPRQDCGAEITEMQVAGRAGREPARAVVGRM